MPTVGWIAEDAMERFAEARHRPLAAIRLPSAIACPACGRAFPTLAALAEHVSRSHPLDLPVLYMLGQPLLREHVVRAPLALHDVAAAPCTYCEVRADGGPAQRLSPDAFREWWAQATDGTWSVRLVHERPVDGSRAVASYELRFRIPDPDALDHIDELVRHALVRDPLRVYDVERFHRDLPDNAAAREYGAALGDYAVGILLKERRTTRSQAGLDEFASKMRGALDTLCHFDRPVALAVCASIQFNLNSFLHRTRAETGVVELGAGFRFFRQITSPATDYVDDGVVARAESTTELPICPVDAVSHRLLAACGRLADAGLPSHEIDALLQLADEHPVTEQDFVKIRVICAEGWLRLGRSAEAIPLLRSLQHTPGFREWARSHLPNSQPHDLTNP